MPKKDYSKKLTWEHLIELFDKGNYVADLDKGKIFSGRTKKELYRFNHGNYCGHWFTRLYWKDHYICTPISRILWILGNKSPIPQLFEVHHIDLNPDNDAFDNLIALHRNDHKKLHRLLLEDTSFNTEDF